MSSRILITRIASRAFATGSARAMGATARTAAARPTLRAARYGTGAALAAALGAGVAFASAAVAVEPTKEEIAGATAAIHDLLDNDEEDRIGPTLVRLAWHASGTYDKESGSGGSDGATMRFAPESEHGANAGLGVARDALEHVKALFPNITSVFSRILSSSL